MEDDMYVPMIGPRKRYNLVTATPSWVYQEMNPGQSFTGVPPEDAATTGHPELKDPDVVKAGYAAYKNLTLGGLFTIVAHYKLPIVVEAIDNPGTCTLELVGSDGVKIRNLPTAVPFNISPGECIKASGGSAGTKVGFLMRILDTVVW